eukprot:gb/GECG01014397.1/.p1 GENE.gb/GECG01014397.1/~~gb/GECG01014397.1/.p1  ORF type:complete len:543 (+),score=98.26 gb/GECG01014397.1/:1-1629(+)
MGSSNKQLFILFEAASGYALFEIVESEHVALQTSEVQSAMSDLSRFSKIVKMKAFNAFTSAENALQNVNDISDGIVSEDLKNFLEFNLPKVKPGKTPKFELGVIDHKIALAIQEAVGVPCKCNDAVNELIRGIRLHFDRLVRGLEGGAMEKAQLGLAHSYSRARVKFNVNKSDNMIIQAICLLDQLDKDVNTFAMRVREWYSWHFPELSRIVKDNYVYARVAREIGDRSTLTEESLPKLQEITMDENQAREIFDAAKASMGMDMSEIDLINVQRFTERLVSLAEYRHRLHEYLIEKMSNVAPNLAALIGDVVGARLISHAGSLTNLAKCPASTVQILGAEKALFRALKTRGNTPKYGLIFHSTFIGRAGAKNKGRISRYLANKCSIASRIDSFADYTTKTFGEHLKDQVEQRLAFYESGATPKKNLDVMHECVEEVKPLMEQYQQKTAANKEEKSSEDKQQKKKAKKAKKNKTGESPEATTPEATTVTLDTEKSKKKKKAKKRSREESEQEGATATPAKEVEATPDSSGKKSKKKSKKKASA